MVGDEAKQRVLRVQNGAAGRALKEKGGPVGRDVVTIEPKKAVGGGDDGCAGAGVMTGSVGAKGV